MIYEWILMTTSISPSRQVLQEAMPALHLADAEERMIAGAIDPCVPIFLMVLLCLCMAVFSLFCDVFLGFLLFYEQHLYRLMILF